MVGARAIGLIWFLSSGIANGAGQERGNGGDVVICHDGNTNEILSMEMVDLFEARTIRHIPIELGAEDLPPVEKAHYAVSRIEGLDPHRAAYYHAAIDAFMEKVWFVDFELPDLNDTGEITIPPGCSIHQIAIHKEPETPNDKEFWIHARYWESLQFDNNQKAALILHEVVFGKLIEQGHMDSRKARAIVSYLASPLLEQMTYEEYEALILLKLSAATHYYYFKDRYGEQDLVGQIFYLPTRKMSEDHFDIMKFCESIAPGTGMYTDRDDFNDYSHGPGVPFRHASSLLADLKRDNETGWMWESTNGCSPSWRLTYLAIEEGGRPRTTCANSSIRRSVLCECAAPADDFNTCKPY